MMPKALLQSIDSGGWVLIDARHFSFSFLVNLKLKKNYWGKSFGQKSMGIFFYIHRWGSCETKYNELIRMQQDKGNSRERGKQDNLKEHSVERIPPPRNSWSTRTYQAQYIFEISWYTVLYPNPEPDNETHKLERKDFFQRILRKWMGGVF